MKNVFFLIGLLFIILFSSGTVYTEGIWTDHSGNFPDKTSVNALAFDRDNTLWIGTDHGLWTYDGISWTLRDEWYSWSHNYEAVIKDIEIDAEGNIWFSWELSGDYETYINRFDGSEWYEIPIIPEENGLADYIRGYRDMAIDGDDIWVTTLDSLYVYQDERWRTYTVEDGLPCNPISMTLGPGGRLWFTGEEQVFTFDGERWETFLSLPGYKVTSMMFGIDGKLWFTTAAAYYKTAFRGNEGILSYDGTEIIKYRSGWASGGDYLKYVSIEPCMAQDSRGLVWFGHEIGAGKIEDGELTLCEYTVGPVYYWNVPSEILPENTYEVFDIGAYPFPQLVNSITCAYYYGDIYIRSVAVDHNDVKWFGGDRYGPVSYDDSDVSVNDPGYRPIPFTLTAFPNPFNSQTTISFILPENAPATLSVYSISGQNIRELLSEHLTAGSHSVVWDGCNDSGNPVSSGIYISRLKLGEQTAVRRMMLIK